MVPSIAGWPASVLLMMSISAYSSARIFWSGSFTT